MDGGTARPGPNSGSRGDQVSFIIVICRAYLFLAPVVRMMFAKAKDVQVIPDRRNNDRRRQSVPVPVDRRAAILDRRRSSPALDAVVARTDEEVAALVAFGPRLWRGDDDARPFSARIVFTDPPFEGTLHLIAESIP